MTVDTNLSTAAYDWLTADPVFRGMVTDGLIGTDATAPTATPQEKIDAAWVFQGLDDEGRPFRDPEGTGKAVVVLSSRSEWTTPNQHNTAAFPALQVLIYVDSTRTVGGSEIAPDALQKAQHIAKRVNARFHLVANRSEGQKWGDMYVHSCLRSNPMDIRDVPGTHAKTVRVEMKYDCVAD